MDAERRWISTSPEATEALGRALGAALPAGSLLALDGDLGAGKTCFVRGLADGLGVEDPVASPTYTLMQELTGGRLSLYHFDAWMEGREKALLADGGDSWLTGDGVAVVEWAERIAERLPRPHLALRLAHRSPEERTVALAVVGEPDGGPLTELVRGLPPVPGLEPAP
jgi:tRNA threonylcarbamoyladenosine biosynthesis protein TsaE